MKKYLGVKLIEARVLSKELFSYYKDSGSLPIVEDGIQLTEDDEPGYLVKYEDGYESWSPKDVFEEAYREIKEWRDRMKVDGENQEYKMRVIIEAEELQRKVDKLDSFLDNIPGEVLEQLVKDEHIRLKQQLMAMQYYLTILVERIENF